MEQQLRVLMVDASTGFYKMERYRLGDFFGPVDLGLYLAGRYNSLNIGVGLLAGSIFPGSNRLIFNGFSPCWGGFYISSMGGAGLIFDNLGINLVSIVGKASRPSVLYLNRSHGEEIQVELTPVSTEEVWNSGRGGIYSLTDHVLERYAERYPTDPRILVTGPAAAVTDFGGICSAPISGGKASFVDTWAGRGGLGSKLYREHGLAAIIYGGTFIDEDFRDRKVADQWFENKYKKKLAAKDVDATVKYRYDPKFNSGGTLGVNYSTLGGRLMAFNYLTIYMDEADRLDIHKKFIVDHYLRQFNEETIQNKQQWTCGEPCAAVCKKMNNEFKKDYEPYQTLGPLAGVFDQRAAEDLNHHSDKLGFDAISAGGVVSWLMECLAEGHLAPGDLGMESSDRPIFKPAGFSIEADSRHNASIGIQILNAIVRGHDPLDLSEGARKFARRLARQKGDAIRDIFVYNAFARKGWMVPNQYWTPGALSPMPIMGKYYMHYGSDFLPPRTLGRTNAERFSKELIMDNLGMCRFHRGWAEEMLPEIVGELFGAKEAFLKSISITASRINSRNASIFWESRRTIDYVHTFLRRRLEIDRDPSPELKSWLDRFDQNPGEAALDYWFEMQKGIHESLREF